MLRRDDAWIWDSWTVRDGEVHHLFFLCAPRALGDPDRRHLHARIGHASSTDLRTWTDHGDVLLPSAGGWDDLALWTGSVVRGEDGRWRMFFTALGSRGLGARDQRIGLAVSDDLQHWVRVHDQPVVAVDPRRYRTVPGAPDASETWRDPFVVRDPAGGWTMLVAARAVDGRPGDDGVLATAHAPTVDGPWRVGPPASTPGAGFSQLEVPQVAVVDGHPVLVFTCHPDEQTAERVARWGRWSTWAVVGAPGAPLTGPWDVASARPVTVDPSLFAAPLFHRTDGGWAMAGFRNLAGTPAEADALFVGDPFDVGVRDGRFVALQRMGAGR